MIGAHYDTVPKSPGVDDNGSGSVAVLELARLLHKHQCKLNMTVIFVLFDMEEDVISYSIENFEFFFKNTFLIGPYWFKAFCEKLSNAS